MKSLNELSACDAARAIESGSVTSEALTRACLERIEARESTVEAWAHLDPKAAIAEARARDSGPRMGPLHGVPVGFKDIIDTADMPTAYGSSIYPGHRPVADAACIALVRAAGGVMLGKTVSTEFAFVNPGKTRNPHNTAHTPGGSSSGSAAAVADSMVPLAFGTQTGGSVIRPASFCGVVGYKPTFGEFSYAGVKLLAGSLDTLGAFSRHVEDLALLRAALLGAPASVTPTDAPPTLGLCRTPWWDQADADSQTAIENAAKVFAAAGATVREIEMKGDFADLIDANQTIMTYEGCRSLAHEMERHADKLSDRLKEQMTAGAAIPHAQYKSAIAMAARCRSEFGEMSSNLDALIVPGAVGEAPKSLASTGDALFNRPWTTIGVPCLTIPGHTGSNGLPVGVQLVGTGADENLLAVGVWAEAAVSM